MRWVRERVRERVRDMVRLREIERWEEDIASGKMGAERRER